jgi:hypothetical protein
LVPDFQDILEGRHHLQREGVEGFGVV